MIVQLKIVMLNIGTLILWILILLNNMSLTKYASLVLCISLSSSLSTYAENRNNLSGIADKSKRVVEDERFAEDDNRADGYQKTLNLNFSPERIEKCHVKALEDYARIN